MWGELMKINPGFSVPHLKQSLPYADPTWLDRFIEGLRQAGIAV